MIFLFALFLVSALTIGAACYIAQATVILGLEKSNTIVMQEMDALLDDITGDLLSDPSPEVNGIDDPVWAWNGKTINGYTISVLPISDRINPNLVRKNIFDKTGLSRLFRPGHTADDLQQFREDAGLYLAGDAFQDFFEERVFTKYFSPYGWANINLTDEFAARSLGTALTGDPLKGEALRDAIRLLLLDRRLMDRENLPAFLGASFGELYPFINAEPLMNINFVEKLILGELLAYPDYHIRRPETICAEVVSRRSRESIGTEDLCSILGIDKTNPLFYYLGCITWFWEITILTEQGDKKDHSLRAVVCRLPPGTNPAESSPVYKIIERRFT